MLSEKAIAVYDYIRRQSERGIPPTVREICAALEIRSTSTVHRYVRLLVEEGYLEKYGNQNRALRLTGSQGARVPLLHTLTPEGALCGVENIRRYVSADIDTADSSLLFAWEIATADALPDSFTMGDIIIVDRTDSDAADGCVLYLTDGGRIVAQRKDDSELLGRIIALIRRF